MVVPYQIWMLQRLEAMMVETERGNLTTWLERFENGREILTLSDRLQGCTVDKRGGLLFSAVAAKN